MARWALRAGHRHFALGVGPRIAGRGAEADMQLDDDSISRRHALFRVLPSGPIVEDLDSSNGTFVNGVPVVGRVELAPGDCIALGSFVLEVLQVAASDHDFEAPVTRPMSRELGDSHSLDALSPRERDVLPRFASGLSAREIAQQLGVGVKTIETYRKRIRHKLGLRTRAQLVRFALEIGLLRHGDHDDPDDQSGDHDAHRR